MRDAGSLPLDFYPSFVARRRSGLGLRRRRRAEALLDGVLGARNRIGVLVETHSWKDYPTRVRITRNSIIAMMEMAARDGRKWLQAAKTADEHAARARRHERRARRTRTRRTCERSSSAATNTRASRRPISGALLTRYDPKKPQIWRIPLLDEVQPDKRRSPRRAAATSCRLRMRRCVGEKLALHGVEFRKLTSASAAVDAEVFRATKVTYSPATFEGHTTLTLEGEWRASGATSPAGSLFVPIAQARSVLLMTLLEPKDPDSLVSWGFFNTAFERKEYMEAYVAEDVAEGDAEERSQLCGRSSRSG